MSKTEVVGASMRTAPLTLDELDDAGFRARDLAWSVVLDEFTKQHEEIGLTYKALGDRIGRSKSQVQRWLASPFNMSIRSLGLLAEGLDVELLIELKDRSAPQSRANYLHPAEEAKASFHHLHRVNQMFTSRLDLFGASSDQDGGFRVISVTPTERTGTGHAVEVDAPRSLAWETALG
jgi:transcriptional regulator with XRE-family HTH domain